MGPCDPSPSSQKRPVPRKAALFDIMSTRQFVKCWTRRPRTPPSPLIFSTNALHAHSCDECFDFRFLGCRDHIHALALACHQTQSGSENIPNPSIGSRSAIFGGMFTIEPLGYLAHADIAALRRSECLARGF